MDPSNLLLCNAGCGNHLQDGEFMVCYKCAEKFPPVKIEYSVREPRNLDHIVPGTCNCECHDVPGFYHCFSMDCCGEVNYPRVKLTNPKRTIKRTIHISPIIGDFTKFVYPLVRPKKEKHDKL